MRYHETIWATVLLALCLLALAGIVSTDAYSTTAGAEAKGLGALQREVMGGTQLAAAGAALASAPEAAR